MTTVVRYSIILILLLFGVIEGSIAQVQEATKILEKIQDTYAQKEGYNLTMTYTMYRGFTGNQITEQYTGNLYKKGNLFWMKALTMEALQFPEGQIKIDHTSKMMYYNKQSGGIENPADMTQILQLYTPVTVDDTGKQVVINLEMKSKQLPLPFQKVVLHIDKDTYQVKKQELRFAKKMPFVTKEGKEEYDSARVEITLSDNPEGNTQKMAAFSDYISKNGSGLQLTNTYKEYTLIDQKNQ